MWCNGSHGISVGSLGQYAGEVDLAENIYVNNITMANAENGALDTVRLQTTKEQYIPVPNDPAMANITCPICQERFETVWHDDASVVELHGPTAAIVDAV